jgi:hypothetical protein
VGKPRKPRKPRPLRLPGYQYDCAWIEERRGVAGKYEAAVFNINSAHHRPADMGLLISWSEAARNYLERAAEWLEYQEGKRG